MTHRFGPRDHCPVRADFIVLGALACSDETGIHSEVIEVLFHDRFAFLDDPRDAIAVLASRLLLEVLEYLFQTFDMTSSLLEVGFKRLAELQRGRSLSQFG